MPTTKTQGSQINKIQILKKKIYIYRAETDSQKRQNKLVVTSEGRREVKRWGLGVMKAERYTLVLTFPATMAHSYLEKCM